MWMWVICILYTIYFPVKNNWEEQEGFVFSGSRGESYVLISVSVFNIKWNVIWVKVYKENKSSHR